MMRKEFECADMASCCCRLQLTRVDEVLITVSTKTLGWARGVYCTVVCTDDGRSTPVVFCVDGGATQAAFVCGKLYRMIPEMSGMYCAIPMPAKYARSLYGAKKYLKHRFWKRGRRSMRELIR